MKAVKLVIAATIAVLLSGCVIYPIGWNHGGGHRGHHHYGGGNYHR
jgi:hypothetical protein